MGDLNAEMGTLRDWRSILAAMGALKPLIDGGLLQIGEQLQLRRRNGQPTIATVEPDGSMVFGSGERFKSPSAAAKSIVKRPVNGWDAWRTGKGIRLSDVRALIELKNV